MSDTIGYHSRQDLHDHIDREISKYTFWTKKPLPTLTPDHIQAQLKLWKSMKYYLPKP